MRKRKRKRRKKTKKIRNWMKTKEKRLRSSTKRSGNMKKMTQVEEDQAKDIGIKEEMNMKKLEGKVITSKKEVRKDLNQDYVKSEVKLRDKIKFDPFSISGLILISMLLGTVEAGKITSSNELYKSDSSWIDRKTNTEKYEDLVIQA